MLFHECDKNGDGRLDYNGEYKIKNIFEFS